MLLFTDDAVDDHNSCFPSHSTVITENGQTKRMDGLTIGEKVLTMSPSGKLVYSRVIMFMDARPQADINSYVVIETFNPAKKIELTKKHLILASKDGVKFETVFAERVQPGDYIKVLLSNKTGIVKAQVDNVKFRSSYGAFAPLTEQGTLFVNGILASCYALTEEHDTAHLSFLPWRYTYDIIRHFQSIIPQKGLHWYARMLRTINSYLGVLPEV